MEKKQNKKKILIIISVMLLIVASITLQSLIGEGASNKTASNNEASANGNDSPSDDWKAALASNEKQVIYLGRPSCSWCNKVRPELDNLKGKYQISFVYVNTDEISEDDLGTILEKLEIDEEEFGTPYLAVIENGKKVTEQVGYLPEDELFNFFQTNGFIDKNVKYE